MKKYLLLFFAISLLFINCKKNDDPVVVEEQQEEPQEEPKSIDDYQVEDFMWQTMNFYYLWQAELPNLSDDIFPTTAAEQQEYLDFLASENDPASFFENKLRFSGDRFSGYRQNYKDLVNLLSGITKSNGVEFRLSRYGEGNDVLGYVNYIVKDSDADGKDIKRGDIFIGVNGQSLYSNRSNEDDNNFDLLFGDEDTYTLNMADVVGDEFVPNGKEITLTKVEGLEEDPILVTNIIEQGADKIGYIMYNSFIGGSGEELNEIFGEFSSAGVTDLVLDLRYNQGGKGYTATILASLIYGANDEDLFFRDRYNPKIDAQFDAEDLENNFVSTTGTAFDNMDTPLNSLNLDRVYILATKGSASASELVMVGLEPYVDVIHIGSTTVGKNQGSNTFVDDPENGNFYDADREDQINPDNQWGLQPIIITVENAAGFSDYSTGLMPDIDLDEDITNLGILGDPNEPMLARAIEEITGVSSKKGFEVRVPADVVGNSKMYNPLLSALSLDKVPTALKNHLKEQMKK